MGVACAARSWRVTLSSSTNPLSCARLKKAARASESAMGTSWYLCGDGGGQVAPVAAAQARTKHARAAYTHAVVLGRRGLRSAFGPDCAKTHNVTRVLLDVLGLPKASWEEVFA